MRIVFLGSGAFGLPTLQHLAAHHQVELVVTQPDRPSGRGRTLTPTPIGAWADEAGLPCLRVEDVNAPDAREHIRSLNPDAMV
ncbi:MAG: hypothetical protein MK095_09575, partial [Phycisphaerales bacterium]|nr:hypothetical protein [Phycisphaerales bacterium]